MTTKKVQPRKARGKLAAQAAADELTTERVRAILSDPQTPSGIAEKLQSLADKLGGATDAPGPETPDFYAYAFEYGAACLRDGDVAAEDAQEAREYAEQITRLAERHEPKAYKVARRCREIYAEWLGRKNERGNADGAHYFVEHVDAVLEGGEDGLIPNPDSKYFALLFVEAFNARGPRHHHVRALLDLIKRVDEGADLNELRDEAARQYREYSAKRKPYITRLTDRLSEVLADEKRADDHDAILDTINELSTRLRVSDLHPEIFPVVARVLIYEARENAKGRGAEARRLRQYLRDLESIAGE